MEIFTSKLYILLMANFETFSILFGIAATFVAGGVAWGQLKASVDNIKEILNKVDSKVDRVDSKVDRNDLSVKGEFKEIRVYISEIKERLSVVESRINNAWGDKMAPASSPRQLNERGEKILKESGIKEIIEEKRDELFATAKGKNPTNPYDAQELIYELVNKIPENYPDTLDLLKDGSFKSGESIDSILFVGGIYLRNLIFKDLGFSLDVKDT